MELVFSNLLCINSVFMVKARSLSSQSIFRRKCILKNQYSMIIYDNRITNTINVGIAANSHS